MKFTKINSSLLMLGLMSTVSFAAPAHAMDDEAVLKQLKAMQAQIDGLQGQVKTLSSELQKAKAEAKSAKIAANTAATDASAAKVDATAAKVAVLNPSAGGTATATAKPAENPMGGLTIGNKNNIKLTLGGFIETAAINRTRNETSDMGSGFSTGIPFPVSPNYHLSEFRGSARQSRLSLLAQGKVDPDTDLSAYYEGDFLGAAPTANSTESNSYTPRTRQIFAEVDQNDINTHYVFGQAWSLVTLNKKGIVARQENVPLTIDAQYVPGFTWTRNVQARVTHEMFDNKLTLGASVESPQAIIFNGPNTPSGSPTFNNGGGSQFASTSTYSTDLAPDFVAKLAYDPGWGHYEVFGIGRFFRDRNNKNNSTIMGGGGGVGAILPIIDKKLDFQLSGMAGTGIGRYGSAQLPDVTIKPDGGLATVNELAVLAGLIGHPTDQWDVYLYGGTERSQKQDYTSGGLGFGYGSGLYNNSSCNTEGGPVANCVANTREVSQLSGGAWWKFYKGSFGVAQAGVQDSFTKRYTFTGVGGAPSTDENITMVSFRYYPF